MDLTSKKCVPCEGGTQPLKRDEIDHYLKVVNPKWEVIEEKSLKRRFKFGNFKQAMEFVSKVANLAEEEGHHPDITINYNRVTLELTTHSIGGLSENDFIIASKVEQLISPNHKDAI